MIFSDFGERFAGYSGITHLMDDLNEGLLQDDVIMMGGIQPQFQRYWPFLKLYFKKCKRPMS